MPNRFAAVVIISFQSIVEKCSSVLYKSHVFELDIL